jgi:L-Ala-D/L-Glu epimerase / N-acetyl-D-glutamate racemase
MNMQSNNRLSMQVDIETWPLKAPFRITGYTFSAIDVVVITLRRDGHSGRGEAAGVYYRNDVAGRMLKQLEAARPSIEAGVDRNALQRLLPAGGARNAVDCALWDLEAKSSGCAAWQIAGMSEPSPLLTTYTIGADTPAKMAAGARAYADARALKLKLTGEPVDAARIRAVREARPDVWMGVDANQGFTPASLDQLCPILVESRVELVEQPFKIGQEAQLETMDIPVPIAADESAQDSSDIAALADRFDVVNIKLDKCGGLTEALAMSRLARQAGMEVMVGNMTGTVLAMAPAFLLGQRCTLVDLDGPLFLIQDRIPAALYENGTLWCPEEAWGGTVAKGAR